MVSKVPGLEMKLESRDLDLQYKAAFEEVIPEAYENLLLDVIQNDHAMFIGKEELAAAWDVFTPVLHEIEKKKLKPEPYSFGSSGPAV